jgi:hypothetical protein
MSDDILTELKADWMECACYEGSLSVDREVIDRAAAEIERLRAEIAGYKENEIQLESRIEWMRERIKEMEIDSVRSARLVGWRL